MRNAIQGIRAVSMIGIFLYHGKLLLKGNFFVTLFFIISGFASYYAYNEKLEVLKGREYLKWILKKYKYWLRVNFVTFVMSVIIRWEWVVSLERVEALERGILSLTLLQTLVPKYAMSYNVLAWFLSVLFIATIFIKYMIRLIKKVRRVEIGIGIVFLIQMGVIFLNSALDINIELYTNPIYRIFDILAGMMIGKMYLLNKDKEVKNANKKEIMVVTGWIILYLISFSSDKTKVGLNYYSIIFYPLIYYSSLEKGCISKVLTKKVFREIAKYSFEFYMLHELIILELEKLIINGDVMSSVIQRIIMMMFAGIISIIGAIIMRRVLKKDIIKASF